MRETQSDGGQGGREGESEEENRVRGEAQAERRDIGREERQRVRRETHRMRGERHTE